jgi:hypothetical protein
VHYPAAGLAASRKSNPLLVLRQKYLAGYCASQFQQLPQQGTNGGRQFRPIQGPAQQRRGRGPIPVGRLPVMRRITRCSSTTSKPLGRVSSSQLAAPTVCEEERPAGASGEDSMQIE